MGDCVFRRIRIIIAAAPRTTAVVQPTTRPAMLPELRRCRRGGSTAGGGCVVFLREGWKRTWTSGDDQVRG